MGPSRSEPPERCQNLVKIYIHFLAKVDSKFVSLFAHLDHIFRESLRRRGLTESFPFAASAGVLFGRWLACLHQHSAIQIVAGPRRFGEEEKGAEEAGGLRRQTSVFPLKTTSDPES